MRACTTLPKTRFALHIRHQLNMSQAMKAGLSGEVYRNSPILIETGSATLVEHRVVDYWRHRYRLTDTGAARVDREVLAKACNKESLGFRRWVTKHVTGVCGVGKWLERWKWQDHSKCPRCDAELEDHWHVYQCPANSVRMEWHGAMKNLRQWCQDHDTNPEIIEVIIKCLTAWRGNRW
jgi:hypothetical protein